VVSNLLRPSIPPDAPKPKRSRLADAAAKPAPGSVALIFFEHGSAALAGF